jgi:selenide,water dikinase
LGTGVITTALKQGRADEAWVETAVASMTTSNRLASEIARRPEFEVHSVTDVTGFGLMGHGREMALGSNVRLRIDTSKLRFIDGALRAVELGCIPAGLNANRDFAECIVVDEDGAAISDGVRALLYDPQTSGGLLISLPPQHAGALVTDLNDAGYKAAHIGEVLEGSPKIILR